MTRRLPKTKLDKVEEIIKKSGNTFHYKVINFLRDKGWEVIVSPYYSDNVTGKTREIDIIAENAFDVKHFGNWLGTLNVQLFIECKCVPQESVFWFDEKNTEKAIERIMKDTSLEHPRKNSSIEKHHYYIAEKVAKLFSSNPSREFENDPIYKALNQSLSAMIYYRNLSSIITPQKDKPMNILETVRYPIIVLNSFDKIYGVAPFNEKPYKINDTFLLEVNYAYLNENKRSKKECFLIDVISFDKFETFLEEKLKKSDVSTICNVLEYEK